jgi:hypothetical protein
MRASGKTADSLEVETSTNSVKLLGSSVFEQLEYGRGSTKSGGTKGSGKLIDSIKQWIKDKGIVSNIKNDKNNSSLAFLITRKIHKMGWNRSNFGGIKLISEVITTKRIQSIIDKVGNEMTINLIKVLEKELTLIK